MICWERRIGTCKMMIPSWAEIRRGLTSIFLIWNYKPNDLCLNTKLACSTICFCFQPCADFSLGVFKLELHNCALLTDRLFQWFPHVKIAVVVNQLAGGEQLRTVTWKHMKQPVSATRGHNNEHATSWSELIGSKRQQGYLAPRKFSLTHLYQFGDRSIFSTVYAELSRCTNFPGINVFRHALSL